MTIKQRKPLKRSGPPKRKAWLNKGLRSVPKVNKCAQRKKLARYKAFMASPEWKAIRKAALERAGNQCEEVISTFFCGRWRCPETMTLTVHHLRYTRFGGKELPKDLKVLCWAHHEAAEAAKGGTPLWQRAGAA